MWRKKIQEIFDAVSESMIKDYNFDMLNNKIILLLEVWENGIKTKYNITISNVSTYCFINNVQDKRKNMRAAEEGDYLECTALNLISEETQVILKSDKERWLHSYSANANLAMEIWNKILLIEARSITINSKSFNLY